MIIKTKLYFLFCLILTISCHQETTNETPSTIVNSNNYDTSQVILSDEENLNHEAKLEFSKYFYQVLEDEKLQNDLSLNCKDKNCKKFIDKISSIYEYYSYLDITTANSDTIFVEYFDEQLIFYTATFVYHNSWNLKSVITKKTPKWSIYKDLSLKENNNIIYTFKCYAEDYKEIFCFDNECDTSYGESNILENILNKNFIFYSEKSELKGDYTIHISGIGTGIFIFITYKNNCVWEYFDAST